MLREWSDFWLRHPGRRVYLGALLCVAWLALYSAQWHRVSKEVAGGRHMLGQSAETAFVPPVPLLRMASLGHQSFLADLLFVRAAHYFVRHLMTDSHLPWIDQYMHGMWGLDAHNRTTYHWAPQVVKFGQIIDQSVAERANGFARLGLEAFPDDPWLYHEIAYNLRYTMEPKTEAEEQAQRALALKYLDIAYSFSSFSYDPNYLASQYSRAGRDDDAVRTALATYEQATEEQRLALRKLLDDRHKSEMAGELVWYDAVKARDWPYLADSLLPFVGAKRVPAPPLHAADPEGWLREPPLSDALRKHLGEPQMVPPPTHQIPADERPMPLPAAATPEKP